MADRNIRRQVQRQLGQMQRDREARRKLLRINRNLLGYQSDSDDADVSSSDNENLASQNEVIVEAGDGEAGDGSINDANDAVAVTGDGGIGNAALGNAAAVIQVAAGDAGERQDISASSDDSSGDGTDASDHEVEPLAFENEEAREAYIVHNIREWGCAGGVLSLQKLDDLLCRLKPAVPSLPLSYKTLLRTPKAINLTDLGNGAQMWYKSISVNLCQMNLQEYLEIHGKITLDISMDGLPLSNSSKIKFWPTLGRLAYANNPPFVVSIYYGECDPEADGFLLDFVNEVVQLKEHGFAFHGVSYPFELRHFILDAPARSLVKCCISHGGYGACEKCTVFGEDLDDRTVYLDLNCPLRTDESFRNRDDAVHHTGESILEAADIGMISQFRLDTFHLVWHGVFRRLLTVWNKWPGAWRLQTPARDRMDTILDTVAASCPSDFNRKPRSIRMLKFFKATEERRLLLYDGILVFKGQVPENVYKNYLLLHAGMYILCSPKLLKTMCDFADNLLRSFITHSTCIYGRRFVVYNVHSLSHLAAECKAHGPADSFSAFDFENSLKSLKATLMSGFKPLQQAAFRDIERTRDVKVILPSDERTLNLSFPHLDPDEVLVGDHFKCLEFERVVLKCDRKNLCFSTKHGDIVVLKNIVRNRHVVKLSGCKFSSKEEFSLYPLPYSQLGIFRVSQLQQERCAYDLSDVEAKCWLMADGESFFVVVKFVEDGKDLYETITSKWLVSFDEEDMKGVVSWPTNGSKAGVLSRMEKPSELSWTQHDVQIMRFCDTYAKGHEIAAGFVANSAYETDNGEKGRGKRKKYRRVVLENSESDTEPEQDVSAPPQIQPPPPQPNVKKPAATVSRVRVAGSKAKSQKLSVPAVASGPTRQEQLRKLNERIVASRQKAMKKQDDQRHASNFVHPKLLQKKSLVLHKSEPQNVSAFAHSPPQSLLQSPQNHLDSDMSDSPRNEPENSFMVSSQINEPGDLLASPLNEFEKLASPQNQPRELLMSPMSQPQKLASPRNRPQRQADKLLESPRQVSGQAAFIVSPMVSRDGHLSDKTPVTRNLFPDSKKPSSDDIFSTLKHVKRVVLDISGKVDLMLINQGRINKALMPHEKRIEKPHNIPPLPLTSMVAFDKFEAWLADDRNLSAVSYYFQSYGLPRIEDNAVKVIIRKVLINEVAELFNFDGRVKQSTQPKRAFKDTRLWEAIQGTLTLQYEGSDLSKSISTLRSWLRQAKYRARYDDVKDVSGESDV